MEEKREASEAVGKVLAIDEFDAVVRRPRAGLSPLERRVRAARGAVRQQNAVCIKMGDACDRLKAELDNSVEALAVFREACGVVEGELVEARRAAKGA